MSWWKGYAGESRGTVKNFPGFDPDKDAEVLYEAMDGFGTDESAITNVLTRRSNAQRQRIAQAYKDNYGQDLIEDLKSEISGGFAMLIDALMCPPVKYDVQEIHYALTGAGTSEDILIEILASRSGDHLHQLVKTYEEEYEVTLEEEIRADTSGYFEKVLVSLLQGNRDHPHLVDEDLVHEDAQTLFDAGEKITGTNETKFITILCTRSVPHLWRVFQEYKKLGDKDLEEAIQSEMTGTLEDTILAIVKCTKCAPTYFAERLYNAMSGGGTEERTLTRIMVTRSEIDMKDIIIKFKQKYEQSLASMIESDTSGDFERTLLKLCGKDGDDD
ncbi:annexin A8-like protein 1 [Latimeria chalumnae]|nr:PREDICTED: annexin A8-like protein 1 isoform X2 [Latimeria chalumnae]|eukprot:XP_005992486.1 PREDICTED: annexin A8-like protein 1 isoform X2 [Latimeria chalumnae]